MGTFWLQRVARSAPRALSFLSIYWSIIILHCDKRLLNFNIFFLRWIRREKSFGFYFSAFKLFGAAVDTPRRENYNGFT